MFMNRLYAFISADDMQISEPLWNLVYYNSLSGRKTFNYYYVHCTVTKLYITFFFNGVMKNVQWVSIVYM